MIKIKHFLDVIENDDGQRIWIEPIRCVNELAEMCRIDQQLLQLAPPTRLWEWLQEHPAGYDFFRARYHEYLKSGPHHELLMQLTRQSLAQPITLLHQCDDAQQNTAMALYEYLTELEAYCRD